MKILGQNMGGMGRILGAMQGREEFSIGSQAAEDRKSERKTTRGGVVKKRGKGMTAGAFDGFKGKTLKVLMQESWGNEWRRS